MYIVTGVSRGLGKAIVEELLQKNEKVLGIGRSHSFNHPNFSFIECDLSNLEAVEKLNFPELTEKITLINNAGIIGNIKRLSEQSSNDLQYVLNVNVTAPVYILKKIYSKVKLKNDFCLVNISSGAANRAIPSWAGYCASKAALNMLTETFCLEELEKGNNPIVYAVAPGVIDTDMQVQIRSSLQSDFSSVDNFKALKSNKSLFTPKEAAVKLLYLLEKPFDGEVFQDLRKLQSD